MSFRSPHSQIAESAHSSWLLVPSQVQTGFGCHHRCCGRPTWNQRGKGVVGLVINAQRHPIFLFLYHSSLPCLFVFICYGGDEAAIAEGPRSASAIGGDWTDIGCQGVEGYVSISIWLRRWLQPWKMVARLRQHGDTAPVYGESRSQISMLYVF